MLGPSQFAAALGLDQYLTTFDLIRSLENGYRPQNNLCLSFGNDHEAIALYYYQKIYKVKIGKPHFAIDPLTSRLGGQCDGLIDNETGIEIKCHIGTSPLKSLSDQHLLQIAGYLYLYQRKRWILMSCTFNKDHTLAKYKLFVVEWNQIKDQWEHNWHPRLIDFVNSIEWK